MNEVVAIAKDWLGTPYVHQAAQKGAGCDCLGLIRGIWRELHGAEPVAVPAYSADWDEPQGTEALWLAAQQHMDPASDEWSVGQILLFRMHHRSVAKHLGVLSGWGDKPAFIHAYAKHGVIENSLSEPWRRRIVARFELQKG